MPISGILSSRDLGHLDPTDVGDPSIVQWELPAATGLYVTYGVVLPLKSVWFAPAYSRTLTQGWTVLTGGANPQPPCALPTGSTQSQHRSDAEHLYYREC